MPTHYFSSSSSTACSDALPPNISRPSGRPARQFARCRDGEAVLFGRHWPGRIRAGGDFATNDVDVTAQIV